MVAELRAGQHITPLILTFDEEPNLARTLESLRWADRVVVLDSGSTDATEQIARSFSNVSWHSRPFDSFSEQSRYGIHRTDIASNFVLALDADMSVPPGLVSEIEAMFLPGDFTGGVFKFEYQLLGHPINGSIYPALLKLFKRQEVTVQQDGHGHKFSVKGTVYHFRSPLIHDDRKSLERWTTSQLSYSAIELARLASGDHSRWKDRLRRLGVMPPLAAALAYLKAGGPFGGAAAARYAYERATFECLLAIRLMSERLGNSKKR